MDGDDGDGDDPLDLHDDLLRAGAFDFDEYTLTAFEYPAGDPDFLRFGEIDLGRAEKAECLVVGSGHGDELAHLLLGDRDLLPKPLIHHILQQGNAGGLLQLLDLRGGRADEDQVVDHGDEAFPAGAGGFLVLHRDEILHAFLVQKPFDFQLTAIGDPHREPLDFLVSRFLHLLR